MMRSKNPKRCDTPAYVTKYTYHKDSLRQDYNCRCGYCDDCDRWRTVWFEIDHFVPKKFLVDISESDYSNLVYSCRSCNNAKRAKWPSKSELIHAVEEKGFIDSCDDAYAKQFRRNENGSIQYISALGKWMFFALKLYKPQHEIIYNIERLDGLIEELQELLLQKPNDEEIKDLALSTYQQYRKYINILMSI